MRKNGSFCSLFLSLTGKRILRFLYSQTPLSDAYTREIAMTLSLVLIAGVTIAITAAYVVDNRAFDVMTEPALAGETTAVGLADPATETLGGHNESYAPAQNDWQLTTVSDLCDAEEMLDCLEYQGYTERELLILGNSCFAVRWREDETCLKMNRGRKCNLRPLFIFYVVGYHCSKMVQRIVHIRPGTEASSLSVESERYSGFSLSTLHSQLFPCCFNELA